MREFLFKAQRKDNGEWVEGNLITNERNENQKYIGYIFDERNGVIEDFDLVEVIPETLCQYTGLNDNTKWEKLTEAEKESFLSNWNYKENRKNRIEDWNGRKIWENDIVKHEISDTVGIVKWYQEDYVGWFVNDIMIDEQQFTAEMWNECELIGNIFDNADLLEVE